MSLFVSYDNRQSSKGFKGPFIVYAGGGLARIRRGGTPISGHSEGGHEEIGVQEGGGGLSDFTILFYFKEMCSLLSAVLNGT